MFCTCQPKTLIKLYVMGGGKGEGWGVGALPLYRKGVRTRDFGPSENQLVRCQARLKSAPDEHLTIIELQTGQSFKCLGLLNASRVVKCDVEGSDEGFTPSVSLPRESTTVPKNVIWPEKYRLRKVSNFGDGDRGVGEIHTRVRNSPIPVLATRLLARGYFPARACISQARRGTVDLLSSSLFLQFQS